MLERRHFKENGKLNQGFQMIRLDIYKTNEPLFRLQITECNGSSQTCICRLWNQTSWIYVLSPKQYLACDLRYYILLNLKWGIPAFQVFQKKKDTHLTLHRFLPLPPFLYNLKSLCQAKVNSYLKCTSVQVIFKWLTPRTASTAKTARGSRTVHTPWAMIKFDVKEGSEPNISWQPHLIRTSRNVTAFKVRGPTTTIASSSRVWSKELW